MNRLVLCYILFNVSWPLIDAEQQYRVDVSYLVADLNTVKNMLKICQVQHGAFSAVQGDLDLSGKDGKISPMISTVSA